MPSSQKNLPPRALNRGQSFIHNKNGIFRACFSMDAFKNFPRSGVLGRPQSVEAIVLVYSQTRIRPYLKILNTYLAPRQMPAGPSWFAAILFACSHKTSLEIQLSN